MTSAKKGPGGACILEGHAVDYALGVHIGCARCQKEVGQRFHDFGPFMIWPRTCQGCGGPLAKKWWNIISGINCLLAVLPKAWWA